MQNLTEFNLKSDGRKLTSTKVIHLKKLLSNPDQKNRIKMLAKQFGISEMQVYRIKRGENWSHIKV
jgi:DNA invertase Pin-like site-specific DNA recombinase